MVLIIDLVISSKNESRFYFLLETFNKLSINISAIQQFFIFKTLTSDFIYQKDLQKIDKLLKIINLKATIDHFNIFTKLLFKVMANFSKSSKVQYYMLMLWLNAYQKHKEALGSTSNQNPMVQTSLSDVGYYKAQLNALKYDRKQILAILESSFYKIYEIGKATTKLSEQEIKYDCHIYKLQFQCLIEYVLQNIALGAYFKDGLKAANQDEQMNVAFATNALFWISYVTMESATLNKQKSAFSEQLLELQGMGMKALR